MGSGLTSSSAAGANGHRADAGERPNGNGRPRPLSDRDREMFELRAAGWTLRQIGERYGISRQRVEGLGRDRGGPHRPAVIAAHRAREAEIIQERSEDIRQWWRDGLPITIVAERLGLPAARVQRAING